MKDMDFYEREGWGLLWLDNFQSWPNHFLEVLKNLKDSENIIIFLDNLCWEPLFIVATYLLDSRFDKIREKAEEKLMELKILEEFWVLKDSIIGTVIHILCRECCFDEIADCLATWEYKWKIEKILWDPFSENYEIADRFKQRNSEYNKAV